jgi:hypothetical protein
LTIEHQRREYGYEFTSTTPEVAMTVAHTSRIRIEKHEGPHRTAHVENFEEPLNFGIHGGIKDFYQDKYGREITGTEYPATLDHIIAGVAG